MSEVPHDELPAPHLRDDERTAVASPATTTATATDTTLRAESILLKAFDSAQESARQSYEAREKLTNLYLVLVGALATGLGAAYQFGGIHTLSTPMAAIALFAASILSATLFGTYVTRRLTYVESLISANLIVEYYVQHLKPTMPTIEEAFRWRLANIPRIDRFAMLRFLVSYPMALGGSLCLAGAIFITDNLFVGAGARAEMGSSALSGPLSVLIPGITAVAAFALTFTAQVMYYVRKTRRQRKSLETLIDRWTTKPGVSAH